MKKLFLILAFLSVLPVFGQTVTIDKIEYKLDLSRKEASVYKASYSITEARIQPSVKYEGVDYPVTSIGERAFIGRSLISVEIPNSVTIICRQAFEQCRALTSVEIPNSVTEIGMWAFHSCSRLTRVEIQDIEAWCKIDFESASNPLDYAHHLYLNGEEITELEIPSSINTIKDYAFYGCSGLTSVEIPNSVKEIGYSAFYGCVSLTSVTIPNSVTEIGGGAFIFCISLTNVVIGNSLSKIGDNAFGFCYELETVYCYAVTPPMHSSVYPNGNVFEDSDPQSATLHVPKGSLTAYQRAPEWKEFGTIIDDLDPNGLDGVTDVVTDANERLVDVYTTSGIRLMHQVKREAVYTLPAGLYIVGGEKVLVK